MGLLQFHFDRMRSFAAIAVAASLAAVLSACASGGLTQASSPTGSIGNSGAYILSAQEQALDCKKLTGRTQLLILQARSRAGARPTSFASRTIHSATAAAGITTRRGVNPAADQRGDRARLYAYNAHLKVKNCASFDLDKELDPTTGSALPVLVPAPTAAPN